MPDSLSKEKRSWNMSRIKNKDTSIEITVRKYLFKQGFRFRKNVKTLPGKPDIVLPKYKTVIFLHGCFWHRHFGCKGATTPKSNIEFWEKKFAANMECDKKNKELLESKGWNVVYIWQCEIEKSFEITMEKLEKKLLPRGVGCISQGHRQRISADQSACVKKIDFSE